MLTLSSNEAQSLGPESLAKTSDLELSSTKRKRSLKAQSTHLNTEQGVSSSGIIDDGVAGTSLVASSL